MHCSLGYFGSNDTPPDLSAMPNVDAAAIAAMTMTDSKGYRYWTPAMAKIITDGLPVWWVVNEYSVAIPSTLGSAVVARVSLEKPDAAPVSRPAGTEPFTAVDWVNQSVSAKVNVLASVGFAFPTTGLERYLFAVPSQEDLLRAASAAAPILYATGMATGDLVPGTFGSGATGISAWWSNRSTVQKVAIVGGGLLVVGGATGLITWGKRRRKAHTIVAL